MNDNLFLLTQRIKKRENDILYNKMQIQKLTANLKVYKNPMTIRQIEQKITQLKKENQILERKNRNFVW